MEKSDWGQIAVFQGRSKNGKPRGWYERCSGRYLGRNRREAAFVYFSSPGFHSPQNISMGYGGPADD